MIKIVVTLLIVSFCVYTVFFPVGGDSPFKWVIYGLMGVLPCQIFLLGNSVMDRYLRMLWPWVVTFAVLLAMHLVAAHEKPVNDIILVVSMVSLTSVMAVGGVQKVVLRTLLWMFLFQMTVFLPLYLIKGPGSGYNDGWTGMFSNANTCSIFLVSTLLATAVSMEKGKRKYLLYGALFIAIFLTRSRNALLVGIAIIGSDLLQAKLVRFEKILPLVLVGVLIYAAYYMMVIEPASAKGGLEMMGKDQGSAGRGVQLLYITSHYDITPFGFGRIANTMTEKATNYPVHNMYVASLYVLGWIIPVVYVGFVYWMYRKARRLMYKICLLAAHFYFFFEPGYIFCVQLDYFLPMFTLCSCFYNNSLFHKKLASRNATSIST